MPKYTLIYVNVVRISGFDNVVSDVLVPLEEKRLKDVTPRGIWAACLQSGVSLDSFDLVRLQTHQLDDDAEGFYTTGFFNLWKDLRACQISARVFRSKNRMIKTDSLAGVFKPR